MILRRLCALLLAVLLGCTGPQQFVRLDPGESAAILHIPRTAEWQPVKVEHEEFPASAARWWAGATWTSKAGTRWRWP